LNTRLIGALVVPLLIGIVNCGGEREQFVKNTGGAGSGGSTSAGTGGSGQGGSTQGGSPTGSIPNGLANVLAPPGEAAVPMPAGDASNLKVLDWAGFKAAVSFTFDDTNSSQIAHYAELQALGVPYTFYLITGKPEANDPTWVQALKDGHEIGNHTKTHPQTGTEAEVDGATEFIYKTFDATAWTMASPYGDASYIPIAKPRFLLNRGVSSGLVGPADNTDPFNTFCYIPATGAPASAFNAQVDTARTAGKWRIVLVHGFTGGTDGAYQPVGIDEFSAAVTYAKSLGDVWIDTMVNVGAYWRGQKAFSQATPVVSGTTTTWTWTLPDHFPPGRTLRVTVDGGTLTQAGAPLVWNEHGYYEVSLDAGSLTLSP
jgi:peptidoglycan/xylan/chitin deacetylase (PgdA/CDA1 family)